jgi:adenine-specific DNA methylase
LLSSLLEAVPFVANISGNYAAYLKDWDPRAHKPLTLRTPNLIQSERKNKAFREDSNQLVRKIQTDILYLDPPYNSRQYASNYFLLELIAEGWFNGNRPKIYGKTGMREYEEQKSAYCQKSNVSNTFQDLIKHIKTRYILLSYNDEGLLSEGEIKDVLSTRGEVNIFKRPYRRYRSINQDETDRTNVYEKLYFVKVTKGAVNG